MHGLGRLRLCGDECPRPADFRKDWLLRHGAQRAIEIISEASRHVPAQLKAMHRNIRWRSIAGIGNVLRHEYHAISDQVIWKVI